MAEKVTFMVLKVNLECPCCYKKVKKILCKFPQIKDQIYSEKDNKVTITVVCCNPERLRDKLCCKGAKVIQSIEIIEPPKPKAPEKPKPKETEKPKVVVEEPKKKPDKKVTFDDSPKEPAKTPPQQQKPKADPKPVPVPVPTPTPAPGPTPPPPEPITMGPGPCGGYPPVRTCCGPCSEGYGGGPCYFGYGVAAPPPPQPCYDGYYGYGQHDRPCHVTRCDYYLSEENPQACSIM